MTPSPGTSRRAALGAGVFGLVATVSYVAQRLSSLAAGEPGALDAIATAHIPFFWRALLATGHGAAAALIVGLALREPEAARALRWLRAAVPPTVAGAIAAAFAWP